MSDLAHACILLLTVTFQGGSIISIERVSLLSSEEKKRTRCGWATDDLLMAYHDQEWGVRPETDNRWFEFIVLETFQAGLSWRTILHKRPAFREAFRGFSVPVVAKFSPEDVTRLLENAAIVRNRRKILSAVENARRALSLIERYGSLNQYFNLFTEKSDKVILSDLQATFKAVGKVTAESIAFATSLLPAPHDPVCFKHPGQNTHTQ